MGRTREQQGGATSAIGDPQRCHWPPVTISGFTVDRGLAFLSFLLTFFDFTVAIVFPLLYKPLEGRSRLYRQTGGQLSKEKESGYVLWIVGNAPAGFRLAARRQLEGVE